ncbi:hypothetical protein [Botryobacter ruber]|uniref:hypothetical protein n=1 Tax=Botryobacter ruber TaxID=2171629 RepID=UPI0037424E2E
MVELTGIRDCQSHTAASSKHENDCAGGFRALRQCKQPENRIAPFYILFRFKIAAEAMVAAAEKVF